MYLLALIKNITRVQPTYVFENTSLACLPQK